MASERNPTRFNAHFQLNRSQAELDFANVAVDADLPLFIDPFAIAQRSDPFSVECHDTLYDFFSRILDSIRSGNRSAAKSLLSHLREPNETRFGYSKRHPRGAGIGRDQSQLLFDAFADSSAVKTGFLSALEECELMIKGIGRDKISDLTTNVLRRKLAAYTKAQCELWGIPTQSLPLPPAYVSETHTWVSSYFDLPLAAGRPVLLVPKAFARFDPAYQHRRYYDHFVLEFLQAEHLQAGSSLVHLLKNGKYVVYKKDIKAAFPCTKENLFQFSKEHPEVLKRYHDHFAELEKRGPQAPVSPDDERVVAQALKDAIRSLVPGNDDAYAYHSIMIGVVEFLFFPSLLNPKKESEIHDGRKRIDIAMENGANSGIFHRLHSIRNLPCAFLAIECKNYGRELGNPELDQVAGRFSQKRGKVGIICCRSLQDRSLFVQRCRDTFKDDRGLVIALDDDEILKLLSFAAEGRRVEIDRRLTELFDEVWFS